MTKKTYIIDGDHFSNLEEFFEEISVVLIPDMVSCKSLDSFNDILRGGYGALEREFVLVWNNSHLSRLSLGYEITVAWKQGGLQRIMAGLSFDEVLKREDECIKRSFPNRDEGFYADKVKSFEKLFRILEHDVELAKERQGETLFDVLVTLIEEHPNVEFKLE